MWTSWKLNIWLFRFYSNGIWCEIRCQQKFSWGQCVHPQVLSRFMSLLSEKYIIREYFLFDWTTVVWWIFSAHLLTLQSFWSYCGLFRDCLDIVILCDCDSRSASLVKILFMIYLLNNCNKMFYKNIKDRHLAMCSFITNNTKNKRNLSLKGVLTINSATWFKSKTYSEKNHKQTSQPPTNEISFKI